MNRLAYFEQFPVWILCFFLRALSLGTNVMGELVNTSSNAVLCYSCMAMPPQYASIDTGELIDRIYSSASEPGTNRSIRLPPINSACRETHVTAQGQFFDTRKYICQTGACVKLKGNFEGETFVIRECWDRLWEGRRYNTSTRWHGCAPVSFMSDTQTEICVCSVDLCNIAASIQKISIFLILSIFILNVNRVYFVS